MRKVTLQLFNNGRWWDAAELSFAGDELSSTVHLAYLSSYITEVPHYDVKDCWACTVNAPVSMLSQDYPGWPALLDDLLPVGKSRDWWLNYLDVARASVFEQNYALLTNACMAPVGNLRIKEATHRLHADATSRFSLQQVVELQHNFLEYANEHGAAVGGATGAGGVAPKLLLMVNHDEVFIDGDFAGKPLSGIPYLTKFARNSRTARDNQILLAEGVFYRVLAELLADTDIETIDVSNMMTYSHQGQVSLWLPRFDVVEELGLAKRLGMESIYSMLDAGAGSYQNHFAVMEKLWHKIKDCTQMTPTDFARQYLARDMLNLVFGNSDNHGRNISFLKREGAIRFAPIYDFAPMKADPEMVTRLFKWERGCEKAGIVRFDKVVAELESFCHADELMAFLTHLATNLLRAPALLRQYQCPQEIIEFPTIGFDAIETKLAAMGLYHE